jgi:hypothetical protein
MPDSRPIIRPQRSEKAALPFFILHSTFYLRFQVALGWL